MAELTDRQRINLILLKENPDKIKKKYNEMLAQKVENEYYSNKAKSILKTNINNTITGTTQSEKNRQKKAQSLINSTGLNRGVENLKTINNVVQQQRKFANYKVNNPSNYNSYNDYLEANPVEAGATEVPNKNNLISKKEFEIYEPLKNKNIRNNLMPTTLKNGTLLDKTVSTTQQQLKPEIEMRKRYDEYAKKASENQDVTVLDYDKFRQKTKIEDRKKEEIKKAYAPITSEMIKSLPIYTKNNRDTYKSGSYNQNMLKTSDKLNSVYAVDEKERLNKGITMLLNKKSLTSGEKSMAQGLLKDFDKLYYEEAPEYVRENRNRAEYSWAYNAPAKDGGRAFNQQIVDKKLKQGFSKELLDLSERANLLNTRLSSLNAYVEGVGNSLSFGTNDMLKDKQAKQLTENLQNVFGTYDNLKNSSMLTNRNETIASEHPIAKTAGEFTGEGIKYAAGTKILSGIPAIQNAGKSIQGTKIGQNLFRTTKGIVNAETYANMLIDQILETVINSPRVVIEGIQNGDSAGDITKQVLKEQAENLALSGIFESGEAIWKYLRGKGLSDDEISVALKNINDEKIQKANERAEKQLAKQKNKSPRDYAMENIGVTDNTIPETNNIKPDITPQQNLNSSSVAQQTIENAENINNLNLSKIYNTDIKNMSVEELQNLRSQLTNNINDYAKIDIQYFANKVDEIDKRMQELVSKYGAFTPGENPYRNIEIPKETEYGKTQRFVRTMAESQNIDDEMLKELKQGIAQGDFSYKAISNKKLINEANAIYSRNPQTAKEMFFGISERGIPAKSSDIALGQKILAEAVQTGDIQTAKRAAAEVSAMLTEAGRTVQAARIFKKLTPEGKMMTAQRFADRLGQKIGKELTIPDDLAKSLINSKTAQESERALNAIYKNIGSQIPSTFKDKFMQWRYMAMLLNPTTHIRNIVGNTAFIPLRKTSDILSLAGEKIAIKSGLMDESQSTKALLGFSKNDRGLKKYGKQVFNENADLIKSGGKYGINNEIEAGRRIFNTGLLESGRKFTFNSLDLEDNLCMKYAFEDNFAQMMKARGYTEEFFKSGTKEANKAFNEVFEYSMDKALKATYRDTSEFANFLNKIENKNWGTRILMGGAFPFKKTPINMLKRGAEYSPIGLIDGVTRGVKQLKNGIISPDQFIDKISQGLTGTALIGLGAWLAHEKIINGSTEYRSKADKYEASIKGIQPFSINVGDGTYTISWLVPAALPMFVGAEIYEAMSNSENPTGKSALSSILTGISKITEPYTELSCLQGVNDLLKGDNITEVIGTIASNYINQFIPTIISKTANTIDGTRRSTYAPTDAPFTKQGQQAINKNINKIPFARNTLQPYVDQWGNEEVESNVATRIFNNFISPGYYKKNKSDVVDREVQSLYESTGDDSVLPKMVSNYRKVNGKTLYLTPEELTKFQKRYGQTAHSKIQSLIYNSKYLIMSTSDKVKAIKDIYDEADKIAKNEFLKGRNISTKKESDRK